MSNYGPVDRSSSPSEARRRVYQRVITPIRKELVNAYNKPTYNILETFLAPLDLSTFPTTFGPEDEDPFHPIRVHTKKIDSKELLRNIVAGPEVEARLKDAVRAARRHERFSVLQRLNGTIIPPFDPSTEAELNFGPMKQRSIKELRALSERLTPPRTVKQLFLPSSRYFMSGFASVPRPPPVQVTAVDAIDAKWHIAPEMAPAIKQLSAMHSKPSEPTLDKVWARWSSLNKDVIDMSSLALEPPLFPLRLREPFAVTYEAASELVACSTPLGRAAQMPSRPTPLYWDVFDETQDISPYSPMVLDEFDEMVFEELSESARPSESKRASESRCLSSYMWRPERPMEAWKHSSSIGSSSEPWIGEEIITPTSVRQWGQYGGPEAQHGRQYRDDTQSRRGDSNSVRRNTQVYMPTSEYDLDEVLGDDELEQFDRQLVSSHFPSKGRRHNRNPYQQHPPRLPAQPRSSPSQSFWSPVSISRRPLGDDFKRHGLDWNAPLQDSSSRLRSPIKVSEPPTPDSNPFAPENDYDGMARRLTYGEPAPNSSPLWAAASSDYQPQAKRQRL